MIDQLIIDYKEDCVTKIDKNHQRFYDFQLKGLTKIIVDIKKQKIELVKNNHIIFVD